ncbi:TonB-dependent receptor [Rhizorhabdus dicambivorans]|nr:TonB-dependent receptor [Rhizorhabdus dicambivorans]
MIVNFSDAHLKSKGSRRALAAMLMRTAIVVPSILAGGAAFAEDPGEIIVTAQRREQAIIDVPISVSVVSAEKVENLNLSTFTSIAQQTPNFNITFNRGSNTTPDLSIRGVRGEGSNGRLNESSVAVYVDEIYLGDESSLTGQMFDVERIEVLRGPQGTLFGRNTTGGLVHFVSAAPTSDFTGKASVLYGSDNWIALNAAVSGPLGENVRTRLAGQFEQHDGHFTNRGTFPGAPKKLAAKEVWSIRSTTDFDLGDASKLRLQVTHSENDSESTPNIGLGVWRDASRAVCARKDIFAARCVDTVVLGGQPRQVRPQSGDAITELSRDQLAVTQNFTSLTSKFETDFGWASLINIANYTRFKSSIGVDGDQSSTPSGLQNQNIQAQFNNRSRQFSEELRLQGTTDTLNWVTGIYYYQDRKRSDAPLTVRNNTGGLLQSVRSRSRVDTKSGAVFGQADWEFADQWTLSAGARYTIENRELKQADVTLTTAAGALPPLDILSGVTDPDPVTKDVTGRVSLTWEPTTENSLYASYSRGAKSVSYSTFYSATGGATPAGRAAALATNAALTGPVGQEHLDAFEIGSKNRFLDRTLTLNLAGFYYLFDGKQELLSVGDLSTGVPIVTSRFLNIGKARIYGAEVELNYAPNDRWDFNVSGGLLNTKITDSPLILSSPNLGLVPLEGKPIPQTPKWNLSATIAHHIPVSGLGVFTLQAEGRAQAKQNFVLTNDPIVDLPSYGIVNFRVLWESEDKKFNAQAFVTNAFSKDYFARMNDTAFSAGVLVAQMGEPRLWGVKLGVAF